MSNIKQFLGQTPQAVILLQAYDAFKIMSAKLQEDTGIAITIVGGYLSKFEIIDEMRARVKDKDGAPANIKPLLDSNKTIAEIVTEGKYQDLEKYVNDLKDSSFNPPRRPAEKSWLNEDIHLIHNKTSKDPRRTGRIISISPEEITQKPEFQKWIINNGAYYGFILYASGLQDTLYYMGAEPIKTKIKNSQKKEETLKKIVGKFCRLEATVNNLVTTSTQVLEFVMPASATQQMPTEGLNFTPVPGNVTPTSSEYILVEGGHGNYWNGNNPYSNKPDPKIGAGDGDNLHSFSSDIPAHPGRTMDIQVEKGLKEFKQKYNKPADIVGMVVNMNEKASSKQVSWKVLIQQSADGIHRSNFTTRGSAKSQQRSLASTIEQIDGWLKNKTNAKKVYFFQHDLASLRVTQIFALYK